jgi:hypothetical protein
MEVKFPTGTMQFRLEDVYRYQEYPGSDNRWSERAFLFRDGSILWEMMGFSCYTTDGFRYSTDGFVHANGGLNLPGRINGDYPQGMIALVAQIKNKGTHISIGGLEVWEISTNDT